jgi:large subunit ribosomal protein L18
MSTMTRKQARVRRHRRIRGKVNGTAGCPRLSVCLTGKNIYVQFIDDENHCTLASYSTLAKDFRESGMNGNVEGAKAVGKTAAEKAIAAGITSVVFDRGGFRYHGKVAVMADAAREAGLKF